MHKLNEWLEPRMFKILAIMLIVGTMLTIFQLKAENAQLKEMIYAEQS